MTDEQDDANEAAFKSLCRHGNGIGKNIHKARIAWEKMEDELALKRLNEVMVASKAVLEESTALEATLRAQWEAKKETP